MFKRPLRTMLGGVFIMAGVLLLGRRLGLDTPALEQVVSGGVVLLGVAALLMFFLSRRWWLLPGGWALLTVGVLQLLFSIGQEDFFTILGVVLLGSSGPFMGVYLQNHRRWFVLLPGLLLWMAGAALLLTSTGLPGMWPLSLGLWAVGLPFLIIFAGNRKAWWALIPAYVLLVVGGLLALADTSSSANMLALWGLWAGALPFWVVYLRNSERMWSLVTAGGLSVLGALPVLQSQQPVFWLALSISIAVGLVWSITLLRRAVSALK